MAYRWFKAYVEFLDDPKMARLPDHLWRRAWEMFAFARKNGGDGHLPPVGDMAWTLHMEEAQLESDLHELAAMPRPMLRQEADGSWFVTNFAKRQAAESDTERQQASRTRAHTGSGAVTSPSRVVTSPSSDLDQDLDQDREREKTESTVGADAPSGKPDNGPLAPALTFSDWTTRLQESRNRSAVLREAFEAFYPGRDPPDFSYLGKTGRAVGGAGRLLELLWQNSTRPPTGDVLAYCLKAHRNGGSRGRIDVPEATREAAERWGFET